MSRHALQPRRRLLLRWLNRTAIAVVVVLAAGFAVIKLDVGPDRLRNVAAKAPVIGEHCPSGRLTSSTVTLTVMPEIQGTVGSSLASLTNQMLAGHECVKVAIETQAPAETIQGANILSTDRAPDIWIPDSSLWVSRASRWQLTPRGSFASSPVVIASSRATLDHLGWTKQRPTWHEALSGRRPLAVPQIADNAAGLSAVITLWQALGEGDAAQVALAGTVLAAGRSGVPSQQEAIAAAQSGSAQAALLPTTVQAVGVANRTATAAKSKLAFVQPTGGSPALDYPILTPRHPEIDPAGGHARAVQAVVGALLSSQARALTRNAGFAQTDGSGPGSGTGAGSAETSTPAPTSNGSPVAGLSAPKLAALVERITVLSAPSRQLVIFDLSGSMAAPAGNGQTRIAFAATAARLAGDLLTDKAQVGLWGFSRDLDGKKAIVKLSDVAELGSRNGSVSHRDQVNKEMAAARKKLGGNGTALYSTAVAGMTTMNQLYDPRAGNAVVIFTDGANDDDGGPSLNQTLARLHELYHPKQPVRLICIGIGDRVNMKELTQLSVAGGGVAYPAKDPKQLPGVLFQAMNQRQQ